MYGRGICKCDDAVVHEEGKGTDNWRRPIDAGREAIGRVVAQEDGHRKEETSRREAG